MLRRAPANSKQGELAVTSATRSGFGLVLKPFKAPTPLAPKRDLAIPGRKRKHVSYKEQGGGGGDENDPDAVIDDEDGGVKKKIKFEMGNKVYGEDGVLGGMGKWCNRKFPVFIVKEKTGIFSKSYVYLLLIRSLRSDN